MRNRMQLLWLALTVAGVVGFGWGTVHGLERQRDTPASPTDRTLAELHAGPVPAWVRLVDGVPRCDRVVRANDRDVVPVQSSTDAVDQPSRVLLIALESDELCASLTSPLLVEPMGRSAYADRVRTDVALALGPVSRRPAIVAGEVFGLQPDAVGEARENVVTPLALMLVCIGALGWQVRSLRARRHNGLSAVGGVGGAAAAPAAGAFEAIARGTVVDADHSLLPSGPLVLSAAAQRHAWRQKHVAPVLLVGAALGLAILSAWGTAGVVNDLRAWYGGIEVPAELKGSTTTKLIVSVLDVQLAWRMPNEARVRTTDRMFMTLWKADDDGGAVRALVNDPDVVTFEEAVDLVPFRIPLLLTGFALVVGCLYNARTTRRSADRLQRIAHDAVEGVLQSPSFVEMRMNGATTGWTLTGVLDGKVVKTTLGPQPGPAALVLANSTGDLVVVKSADGADFTPLFFDGEPFAWSPSQWATAQAVLQARGSSTRLTV